MRGRSTPLAISLGFVCLQLARLALSFDRLPARMATHFDLAGPAYHLFVLFWAVAYLRGLRRPDGA